MKRSDVDELEKLTGQLKSLHQEITALGKKSPNDAVNNFKLKFVNSVIVAANEFLGDEYRPFTDFDSFDLDDVPSNSDVTFIVSQYLEAVEKYRSDNVELLYHTWYFILEDSDEKIKTGQPAKLKR